MLFSGHETRLPALPPPERLRAGRRSASARRHGHDINGMDSRKIDRMELRSLLVYDMKN